MNKSEKIIRKFIQTWDINDYQIETDDGFVDIKSLHKTIPYLIYEIKTKKGCTLKCADDHILFDENLCEKFCKEFKIGDSIYTKYGVDKVTYVTNLKYEENMYDFELCKESKHRYYTNGILSHNTLLAKKLAEEIFGSEDSLVRFDMSEYSDQTAVNKLIGSSAGYIGYSEGGLLTEAIKSKPYCVLLLDEIEKAHKDVYNIFLQVFDDGTLTDNSGNKVNFSNVIIIMTSNIGAKDAASLGRGTGFQTNIEDNKKSIIEKALNGNFPPELINRLTNIIHFNTLTGDNLKSIIELELNRLKKNLKEIYFDVEFGDGIVDHLFGIIGSDKNSGARKINRAIENEIENQIVDLYLENEFEKGHTFKVNVVDNKIEIS